ncbi:MAG: serine/threonine protein kinase [Marinilabiliales bacterium]|nr:serine/threonine protein kinase [Marinilabiliales bacterium]
MEPSRTVALKMLLPHQLRSPEMRARFRFEARAGAALEHPAILPVYQVGEQDGMPHFTMKFATGGTLAERMTRFIGQWRAITRLVATVADAVHFAHEHGVLHRDLKPGNILFDEADQPYVSDFGLARLVGEDSNRHGRWCFSVPRTTWRPKWRQAARTAAWWPVMFTAWVRSSTNCSRANRPSPRRPSTNSCGRSRRKRRLLRASSGALALPGPQPGNPPPNLSLASLRRSVSSAWPRNPRTGTPPRTRW